MLKCDRSETCVYLFAYGTLRVGIASPVSAVLERTAEYVAEGYLLGELYDLGDYPGAVLSFKPEARVWGDIYLLGDAEALFAALDEYEECTPGHVQPQEYVRTVADVVTRNGCTLPAWTYLYNLRIDTLTRIACGDYLRFIHEGEA